jgi:hypothetical protein
VGFGTIVGSRNRRLFAARRRRATIPREKGDQADRRHDERCGDSREPRRPSAQSMPSPAALGYGTIERFKQDAFNFSGRMTCAIRFSQRRQSASNRIVGHMQYPGERLGEHQVCRFSA